MAVCRLASCALLSKREVACACPRWRERAASPSAISALSSRECIFATDADEEAVDFARRGVYPKAALSGLTEEQVGRYFTQDGLGQCF